MNEFFANIWDTISLLVWSDWLTFAILIAFLVLGIKRGLAKELINLAFLILAIIIAWPWIFKIYQVFSSHQLRCERSQRSQCVDIVGHLVPDV